MLNNKFKFFIIFYFYIQITVLHSQRYICTQNNSSDDSPVINFYISKEKIYMAGLSGNGVYLIIENNLNGLLAINASKIGKDFGIQALLLNKIENNFSLRSQISNKNKKSTTEITGKCKFLI